jgi:peptide deformylase
MAILPILHYPDARLEKKAALVSVVDERVRNIVADMAETMYAAPGIGLAATQVNIHERIVVIDISETKDQLLVLINPEIIDESEELQAFNEGCLSVPGIYDEVVRPAKVSVRALDLQGQSFELHADDLLAVCIQHELDHLEGHVFVEYLSRLKQNRIRQKLQKIERERQKNR